MIFALLKMLFPLLMDTVKEIFNPAADEKKTNAIGRASALLNVVLLLLLVYTANKTYILNGDYIEARTRVELLARELAEKNAQLEELDAENDRLNRKFTDPIEPEREVFSIIPTHYYFRTTFGKAI